MSIESDYNTIAQDMTNLLKDELVRQKLVNTGKLLNSIRFTATKTSTGYKFSLFAEDYFSYLDNEYHLLDNMFKSSGYQLIEERLTTIVVNSLLNEFD